MKTNYEVLNNEFHGGRVISEHRSLRAAIRSLKRASREHGRSDCCCGGPRIRRLIEGPLSKDEWTICNEERVDFNGETAYMRYTDYLDDYNLAKQAETARKWFINGGYAE